MWQERTRRVKRDLALFEKLRLMVLEEVEILLWLDMHPWEREI
jgi:hypothetical protein